MALPGVLEVVPQVRAQMLQWVSSSLHWLVLTWLHVRLCSLSWFLPLPCNVSPPAQKPHITTQQMHLTPVLPPVLASPQWHSLLFQSTKSFTAPRASGKFSTNTGILQNWTLSFLLVEQVGFIVLLKLTCIQLKIVHTN